MTTTSTFTWLSLVIESDPEHYKTGDAYRFSNNRTFESTDKRASSGIYSEPLKDSMGSQLVDSDGEGIATSD